MHAPSIQHLLHLYLQKLTSGDAARAWVLTRPDRTQFLFDADGYQSGTRDKNGNELLFTYDRRKSNNKPIKFLRYLTDAATRQTLTFTTDGRALPLRRLRPRHRAP